MSLFAAVPVLGFVLSMRSSSVDLATWLPHWFRIAAMPGLPTVAWMGVLLGLLGVGLRLWERQGVDEYDVNSGCSSRRLWYFRYID